MYDWEMFHVRPEGGGEKKHHFNNERQERVDSKFDF